MPREAKPDDGLSVARIVVQAADCQDSGIGIVVTRRPLTLLVPSHLIELVEQGRADTILINGFPHKAPKIVPAPALERDYLSILQFRKERLRDLTSAHLPRRSVPLRPGQSISLQRLSPDSNVVGKVVDVRERGDGISVVTDIAVCTGDSGSPLLVSGRLAAVCQGMIHSKEAAVAVAIPLSQGGLTELRRLRRWYRINLINWLITALLAVALAFGGFALYSANTFTLASVEVPEDGGMILVRNAQALTLRPMWSRSFDTPIRRVSAFSSRAEGNLDRIAVGTLYQDGRNGAIHLLDSLGRTIWSYSVPDGECIYSTPQLAFDGYLVDVIHIADLDKDGVCEILVAFVHNHYEPCKLVVFDLSGDILAEYWHPGYIRTIASGGGGSAEEVLVVLSASNNAIATDWWNPQTLFAFRGLDIAGQGPPYDYLGASERIYVPPGTELWYKVIVNVDPNLVRAKCYEIDIRDFDGDGVNDIQAALSDGRFFYLDEGGTQTHVELGDQFHRQFPDAEPPPLIDVWEYYAPDQTVE